MTKTQGMGCIFLGSGTLIVLAVALFWLLAPIMVPRSLSSPVIYEAPGDEIMAPALSPFTPPAPSATDNEPQTITKKSEPLTPSASPAAGLGPSGWPIISHSDADARAPRVDTKEESLRLAIPTLDIDAPVLTVGLVPRWNESRRQQLQWSVPDAYAVGWHESSAPAGQPGNTVLNGHNNIHGSIFGNLVDLTLGDEIILYEAGRSYVYQVTQREFLREEGETLRTRLRNARWIAPSGDTRLTIVTCWPNTSNSHRLVVIAQPLGIEDT